MSQGEGSAGLGRAGRAGAEHVCVVYVKRAVVILAGDQRLRGQEEDIAWLTRIQGRPIPVRIHRRRSGSQLPERAEKPALSSLQLPRLGTRIDRRPRSPCRPEARGYRRCWRTGDPGLRGSGLVAGGLPGVGVAHPTRHVPPHQRFGRRDPPRAAHEAPAAWFELFVFDPRWPRAARQAHMSMPFSASYR